MKNRSIPEFFIYLVCKCVLDMIQKYKATIPLSKKFFRNYELKGNMSLYAVHEFLCSEFLFSPDQMVLFQGINAAGKVVHEYGLFDMGDGSMDNVTLRDTITREEVTVRYIYNLAKNLYMDLTWEGEEEDARHAQYPRTAGGKGDNPLQFSSAYKDAPEEIIPAPHPDIPDDDEDFDDEDDDDEDDDETDDEGFDEDELPEGEETVK